MSGRSRRKSDEQRIADALKITAGLDRLHPRSRSVWKVVAFDKSE